VPVERLGESLAFINWTVLTALAVGTFAAVVAGRFLTEATRGYLAFTAFSAAIFAALAWAADGGLPPAAGEGGPLALATARRAGLAALAILAVAYGIAIRRGGRAPMVAAAGVGAALVTVLAAAWSLTTGDGIPTWRSSRSSWRGCRWPSVACGRRWCSGTGIS
jgi:hypothetical protein